MSEDKVSAQSPESQLSPKGQPSSTPADYFAPVPGKSPQGESRRGPDTTDGDNGKEKDLENTGDASATTPGETASTASSSVTSSRKPSITGVTFRNPRSTLPQGSKKPHGGTRIREASPPHQRFESHVAFDNVPLGESTEYNPISFTLNVRHAGFQYRRRHRTFMVGVDDNAYSDHALQWLLEELVDDGDEIVCVRVIETQMRLTDKAYQEEAKTLMDSIQAKNSQNHAIGLVLEYAVGKLHSTFQHLIKIYQPSMLVVGTKGRSLDGLQGYLVGRNSFSKYCLQYSPVPVVVVRPTEKRERKKAKRAGDPTRQSYAQMLSGLKHEADSENSSLYELEPKITADEEAHKVAVAVGLPAAYDPTIKPIDPAALLKQSHRRSFQDTPRQSLELAATGRVPAEPRTGDSGEESEDEEEFEVSSGAQLLKKEKLHVMEVNEGAALKQLQANSIEEEEEE